MERLVLAKVVPWRYRLRDMRLHQTAAGLLLESRLIGSMPGILHGFGLRGVAAMEYLDALGAPGLSLAETNQLHGRRVHRLPSPSRGLTMHGDAFITDSVGVVCSVRTADCVPILIADPRRHAVAAVHAGWRGTAADVAGAAIGEMAAAFGMDPKDCMAAIGPRICGGCYEVGVEVLDALDALGLTGDWRAGERAVDLGKANAALLERAGVPRQNVTVLPQCTRCDRAFASWRRDGLKGERQESFIAIHC